MPVAPRLTARVRDPGSLVQARSTDQIPVFCGVAPSGSTTEILSFGRVEDVEATYGRSYLTDLAALAFARGVRTVKLLRLPTVTAAAMSAVVQTGGGGSATVAVTADQRFLAVRCEVTTAGALGTAQIRFALDAWDIPGIPPTWSTPILVPIGGVTPIPGTGVTFTFTGTLNLGSTYTATLHPGHYDSTGVAALAGFVQAPSAGRVTAIALGGAATAASLASVSSAIGTALFGEILELFNAGYFVGGYCDAGSDTPANTITAFASVLANPPFGGAGYGYAYVSNPRSQVGRGLLRVSAVELWGLKIAGSLISTDPGRRADGPLPGVVGLTYDARLQGTLLHDASFLTLQSERPNISGGFFIQRARLRPTAGEASNFVSWQFASVAIEALSAAQRVLWRALLDGFRQTAGGTLDPLEIAGLESVLDRELETILLAPQNARGLQGHVSAARAVVSPTTILPSVSVDLRIRPLGYPEDITFTLEYAGEV